MSASSDKSSKKTYLRGTHRVIAPEATVEHVQVVAQTIGVTRVANVTGLDVVGIPVFTAMRPGARSISVSQGKGLTSAAARASALMESLELFHAETIRQPLRSATFRSLQAEAPVVDVNALPRAGGRPFNIDEQILWIEGEDLASGTKAWLPLEVVHTNYTRELRSAHGVFAASSNGLASGNHILEAVLHGMCEVIERDATTLWDLSSRAARKARRLDLTTVDDPDCLVLLDRIESAGFEVLVFDITSDVGVPAFYCTIVEPPERSVRVMYAASGMGCHPAVPIALSRALTEAAQSRLTAIVGSRDDLLPEEYGRLMSADSVAEARSAMQDPPTKVYAPSLGLRSGDLADDVTWVLDGLRGAGITKVYVVDLTDERLGIPVVRVVVPGMEGPVANGAWMPGTRARALAGVEAK